MAGSLTWLGHASFRFDTPSGKRVYVDPFLAGNPKCPENEQNPERCDLILLTHGHSDHVGMTPDLVQRFSCPVVAQIELAGWLGSKGVEYNMAHAPNKGGTVEVDAVRVTLTNAFHSSSSDDGAYTGESCGLVVNAEGMPTLYFAGDTCVFGDMQLIARIYEPEIAILPIGDHFTMSPKEAAVALELLGNPRCVPCHYGTFPLLTGTPDELQRLAPDAQIHALEPGETLEL